MVLSEEFGPELPTLAHDHVRAPALDEITEGGQLGANVEPGEELPDHDPVGAVHVHLGEPAHQRHPLIAGRLVDRREREAETLDIASELTLGRDEHVVPGPKARLRERSQWPDVSGAPAGCEEDAHAVGRSGRRARTRGPGLGSEGVAARPSEVSRQCSRGVAMPRACSRAALLPAARNRPDCPALVPPGDDLSRTAATQSLLRPSRWATELGHRRRLFDGEDRHLVAIDRSRFAGARHLVAQAGGFRFARLQGLGALHMDMTRIVPLSRSTRNIVPFMPSVCPYSVGSTFFFVSRASSIASGEAPS